MRDWRGGTSYFLKVCRGMRRVGPGAFRKLPGGTHEEWLFEGLFEELLFDIRETAGLSCCKVKEGAGVQILSTGARGIQRLMMKRGFDTCSLTVGVGGGKSSRSENMYGET